MDNILTMSEYGICVFSFDILQEFLKKNKIRSKKLLDKFQKDDKLYLDMQKKGIWVPFVDVGTMKCIIKLEGFDEPFNELWEQKLAYSGFNIEIENALWISATDSFLTFQPNEYIGEEGSYVTKEGIKSYYDAYKICYETNACIGKGESRTWVKKLLYTDFKYDVPSGKYLLSVKGYARKKRLEYPEVNYGFLFSLKKVEEFDGFKNPRENSIYNFNVVQICREEGLSNK